MRSTTVRRRDEIRSSAIEAKCGVMGIFTIIGVIVVVVVVASYFGIHLLR